MTFFHPTPPAIILGGLLLAATFLGPTRATGTDFRVDNEVSGGNSKEPDTRSTTIFLGDNVYDYMEHPAETIVLEKALGRFALLDTARRVRTELSTRDVLAFNDRLKQLAAVHKDPFLSFLADPKFTEQYAADSHELTLASPMMTYQVKFSDPGTGTIAQQYREFSDWYARLNTMLIPGARPPFARLLVNEALAKHGAMAEEVRLTVAWTPPTTNRPVEAKPMTMRSRHRLLSHLSSADMSRVSETRGCMRTFTAVAFEQYRKPAP
ncbi:MAG: hypothetical protein ABSG68_02540 [Thermoguttaceae bacterium]|jgi:hypothetical protein